MTRLRKETAELDVGWVDVFRVIQALGFATRNGLPATEVLKRIVWEHNLVWETDATLDEYLAAIVAEADACAETGEGGGAPHLVDEHTRRQVAGETRDELRRLLAEAGLA